MNKIQKNTKNRQKCTKDYPEGKKILEIIQETHDVKTFIIGHEIAAKPGQYVMVWVPGIDEKPFTLTGTGKTTAITVKKRGPVTGHMHDMKKGDILGIRGPYGNGTFDLRNKKKIILVGGGCGTFGLDLLMQEAKKKNIEVEAIIGADTKKNLLFHEKFRKASAEVAITTDDGSEGEKGFTTKILEEKLRQDKYDAIYTCGPEIMMKFVLDIGIRYNTEVQASLERYMKCGFGVCGQCALDPSGLCVCKDGPVFSTEILKKIDGFGQYTRDKTGKITEWKDMC